MSVCATLCQRGVCSRLHHCRRSFRVLCSQQDGGSCTSSPYLATARTVGIHLSSAGATDLSAVSSDSTDHRHPHGPQQRPSPWTALLREVVLSIVLSTHIARTSAVTQAAVISSTAPGCSRTQTWLLVGARPTDTSMASGSSRTWQSPHTKIALKIKMWCVHKQACVHVYVCISSRARRQCQSLCSWS